MTPQQILLLRASWARLDAEQDAVAAAFYDRLFKLDPQLQRLFRGDMHAQGRKLMQMIGAALRGLDELDQLLPVVRGLGARHASYGTVAAHYGIVGSALLWALGEQLDQEFTPEVEAAWTEFYTLIANNMQGQSG